MLECHLFRMKRTQMQTHSPNFLAILVTLFFLSNCAPAVTPTAASTATAPPTLSPTAVMTHGPLVGGVTAQGAIVWLRTNEPAHVKIEYTPQNSPNAISYSDEVVSTSDSDFTLHIPLQNLAPATRYDVRVWLNGREQTERGQFKTFPNESDAAPFKMVVLTDFGYVGSMPVRTFQAADQENPDLVFIGGDFDHRDPKLLPDKRKMFQDLYSDDPASPVANLAALILHRYPLAHQWDDHDYGGDNSDRNSPWRATALQVFREYFPSYPLGKYGIYQSFRFGKQVELFVLDNRSQRDPNSASNDASKSMLDGEHHADGQLQWLLDGLKNSTATWKLIMSASAMNNTLLKGDSWANFAHERDTILQFIHENKIAGVILIAGDLHGGALDDGRNAGIPSAIVPGANLPVCFSVPELKLGEWSNGTYGSAAHANNHVPCAGYGVIAIQGDHARIEIKDDNGSQKLEMELEPSASYATKP